MRKILLSIWFIVIIVYVGNTEELLPFSLTCNLDNADLILQAEIIDVNGNLHIEHFYKGNLSDTEIINIEEFHIEANTEINPGFPSKIGQHVIIFITRLESSVEFHPSSSSWVLSTLWVYGSKIAAVYQPVIPGGYSLKILYEDKNELTTKIDHWLLLESILNKSDEIDLSKHRVNYLTELLKWYPFKEDVVHKLFREESIDLDVIMEQIWFFFNLQAKYSPKQYECGIQKKDFKNCYRLIFILLERHAKDEYKDSALKIISYCKTRMDNMEWRKCTEVNERFILEFYKYMNENPVDQWEAEKEEISIIINRNKEFYNTQFLNALRNEIN